MPATITCQCGAILRIPESRKKARIVCPRCQAEVHSHPGEEGIRTAPTPPRTAAAPESTRDAPTPAAPTVAPDTKDVPVEVAPDAESLEKDRKRSLRAQRRGLKWVNLALAFHYPAPAAFALVSLTAGLALGLSAMAHSPWLSRAEDPAYFFCYLSAGLFLFLGLLEMTPNLLALSLTDPAGRMFFAAAFVVRCVSCLCAFLVFIFPDYGPGQLGLALLAMIVAWALWMWGLNRLGHSVARKDIYEGVERISFRALRTLGVSLGALFFALLVLFISVRVPFLLFVFTPAMIGAALRIAFNLGDFDSIWRFFLAPTGIPFILEYVNFISGVRTVIERRA